MGTLRGDNGGGVPSDGGGLPDLPPEWGVVVIPDDAAELDHEAALIRRELRREVRHGRWRRGLGLRPPAPRAAEDDAPPLGLPLLIMSIAIIATLASLFAVAWPTRDGHSGTGASNPAIASANLAEVPDITLVDPEGTPLRLRDSLPAVVLLVDNCQCDGLITATAGAASAGVTILVVAHTAPKLPGAVLASHRVSAAADPQRRLLAAYAGSPPATGATAVLIKSTGEVVAAVPGVTSVDDIRPYLNQLT